MSIIDTREYLTDHSTLVSFAYWLEEQEEFRDKDEMLYFFEKPWKKDDLWETYCEETA